MLSPDEAVRSAISQVYALFGQLGSARQVMMDAPARPGTAAAPPQGGRPPDHLGGGGLTLRSMTS